MSAARVEAVVLSPLLAGLPPMWVAPTLLRALGLTSRPELEVEFEDSLERVATSPAERAA